MSSCFYLIADLHLSALWNGLTLFCTVVALLEWLNYLHVIFFLWQVVLHFPKTYVEVFPPLCLQVESLQAIVKDKTDDHASLLAANHQAQRDLAERNDEIDKLAGRIRELEQALLNSAENNRLASQLEQELHRVKLREQELTQVRNADFVYKIVSFFF